MARDPLTIKDRVATGDDVFELQNLPGGKVRLIPDPENYIAEQGTDVNAALMQPWEDVYGALVDGGAMQLKMLHSGRVAPITHRGSYDPDRVYALHDFVLSAQGNGFVARQHGFSGITPPETAAPSDHWAPLVW